MTKKRLASAIAMLVFIPALTASLFLGWSEPLPGVRTADPYAGLDDPQAVSVLKQEFGQGTQPAEGRLLYDLILQKGYQRALDIGTAKGYSSAWIALAMKKTGGRLITIEIDPETAKIAQKNFDAAGVSRVIDLRVADALLEIPKLSGDFDFVFTDTGIKGFNKKVLDLVYARLAPGGVLTAHNADHFDRHDPEFLKVITTDPNLETTVVPTPRGAISVTFKKNPRAEKKAEAAPGSVRGGGSQLLLTPFQQAFAPGAP